LELLDIFQELSNDRDKNILHSVPYKEAFRKREQDRLKALYAFIDLNYARRISIKEASQLCHLSEEAFCRFFKKMTKLTFTEFLNHYRISQSKRLLTIGESVTNAAFFSGYESIYYYSKVFKRITGMTPTQFVGSLG
jgi:AraC-like DNA-binding protein